MITRRYFCGCLAGGFSFAAGVAHAQFTECAVFTSDRQKWTAPDDAIARLKAGNERFASGKSTGCDLMAQVRQTAGSQSPYAAIVGCIDSRVPPNWSSISTLAIFSVRASPATLSIRIFSAVSNMQPRSQAPRRSSSWGTISAERSTALSMMSDLAISRLCLRISSRRSPL